MRFRRGRVYTFEYDGYKHDPSPYVYVFDVQRKAIEGINLHYLILLRGGFSVDRYKPYKHQYWAWAFRNARRLGFFGNLIDVLREPPRMNAQWPSYYKSIKRRFPWAVKGYRRYLRKLIKYPEEAELI